MGENSPNWINIEFFEVAIRNYKNDDTVQIVNFETKPGFNGHLASTMFQYSIVFESLKYPKSEPETLNVVIKAEPVNEDFKMEVVAGGPLFRNEMEMYRTTIPAIQQLFKRSGLTVDIAPELIYVTEKPFPIIILKDLSCDGFLVPLVPLDDIDDSKLIIQRLAQFHAASYYLTGMNKLDLTTYNYSIFENESLTKVFYRDQLQIFREVLETWDGYQHFIPKLDRLIDHLQEVGKKCYAANKRGEGFNVLNHGDFHLRNMLCKHNSEKQLEKFVFIDYQLGVFCSPAIDLSYIAGIIKRDANGELPFEDMIVFYHQEFVKALQSFGFSGPVPTLVDLNVELLRHGQINVVLLVFIPFSFIDWQNVKLENIMGAAGTDASAKQFRKELYNQPICKKLLLKTLQTFVHKDKICVHKQRFES